jgi:hypothetical protein
LAVAGCTTGPATAPSQTARGVLLDVQTSSAQKLDQFSLRTDDGRELTFVPAAEFNAGAAHAMTPSHMRAHMALAERVSVTYREERGTLVAVAAADASGP